MAWNVFVLGFDELGERLLPALQHAEEYAFHPLLPLEEAVHAEQYDVDKLLDDAVAELEVFPARVDAVVGYWDFPTSALMPLIRQRFGLRGPSLEAVLKCEHKYWSRLEQARSVSGCVPPFQVLDPFGDDPVSQVQLGYPFWIKPVKGHSSQLGFRVDDPETLTAVLPRIREGIGRLAEPFTQIASLARLPEEIRLVTGHHCILEGLISAGRQCTLEGYVLRGEVHVYGVIDTVRDQRHRSVLSRYVYPSSLPDAVQHRMISCARRFIEHIGYDDAPFNIEFYYDGRSDRIWLLEVNARLSRSHSAIFLLVDGAPHLQVMVDVALGLKPRMPHRRGRYAVAAKHMMRVFADGIVRSVPSPEDIARVERRFPGTVVEINVRPGMQLSELLHQDEYSYELGVVFTGAGDEAQLGERLRICESLLPFEIDPVGQRASA
ncbi:ATP-grasp domain-containing protein [Spiribacter halobius]|uniref:D-alanine--D-alanine ligase n=1 Tax=Sediminicurvatus halobius TaxID=2182432 RepID=A0A2U2N298_9GAMM|nr:ATP-grasp domain-containing protein [Spiribacter halobius]PWG63341.1 D-alanine--D-alanine ligase [Spiribacter halobius]UEX79180.1 ATP-grasp domain-containing protein [Spiribacter halobius]